MVRRILIGISALLVGVLITWFMANAGVGVLREAAICSPNTQLSDFTARKLSNPRFRGIGSSPANPGIATYFGRVPQLNSNSSSIDLLNIEQVEFVRGPQSPRQLPLPDSTLCYDANVVIEINDDEVWLVLRFAISTIH